MPEQLDISVAFNDREVIDVTIIIYDSRFTSKPYEVVYHEQITPVQNRLINDAIATYQALNQVDFLIAKLRHAKEAKPKRIVIDL